MHWHLLCYHFISNIPSKSADANAWACAQNTMWAGAGRGGRGCASPFPSLSLLIRRVGDYLWLASDMQDAPRCWLLGCRSSQELGFLLELDQNGPQGPSWLWLSMWHGSAMNHEELVGVVSMNACWNWAHRKIQMSVMAHHLVGLFCVFTKSPDS